MDTLYAREAAEEARHQTLEERLEDVERDRDLLRIELGKKDRLVGRLCALIEETASGLDHIGFPDSARLLREKASRL